MALSPEFSEKAAISGRAADQRPSSSGASGRSRLDPSGCCGMNAFRTLAGVWSWNLGAGRHGSGRQVSSSQVKRTLHQKCSAP